MPVYEYRCRNGHTFEVFQSMSDDPVTACQECGAPVERVFHPVAVHFKGSGFYTTDYARKGSKKADSDGERADSDGGGKESSESSSGDGGTKKSGKESSSDKSGSKSD